MHDLLPLTPTADGSAVPAMHLPTLGNWHHSSQELRAGLFVQELLDGAQALAEAWIRGGWLECEAEAAVC